MSVSTDSNDVSDIFWPGYVDAISNLAINLLFVIAIMAIVVISATLQLQELIKRKDRAQADDVAFTVMESKDTQRGSGSSQAQSSTNAESPAKNSFAGGNTDRRSESPNWAEGEKKSAGGAFDLRTSPNVKEGIPQSSESTSQEVVKKQQQEKIKQQAEQIKELKERVQTSQAQLEKAQASLQKSQAASGKVQKETQGPEGAESESGRVEQVTATTPTQEPTGKNFSSAVQSGVIVIFNPNVTQLTEAEAQEFLTKAKTFAQLNSSNKWRIQVVTPKGFSEAARLAFYRANAVRNVMLNEGVPRGLIDLRIVESEQSSADNARVIVKPVL